MNVQLTNRQREAIQGLLRRHYRDELVQSATVRRLARWCAALLGEKRQADRQRVCDAMLKGWVEIEDATDRAIASVLAASGIHPLELWPEKDKRPITVQQRASINRLLGTDKAFGATADDIDTPALRTFAQAAILIRKLDRMNKRRARDKARQPKRRKATA